MTTNEEDLSDDELLALPSQAIQGGELSRLWAVRSGIQQQREFDEAILELTGASSRHLMIFPDQDPKEKRRHQEEDRRRHEFEQAMQQITEREDRLLVRIEEQQRIVERQRQEIDERAIKLHDGRRAYVDGDGYVDAQGKGLRGADHDEAKLLHQQNPNAATAQEKAEIDRKANELEKLRQDVQQHRAQAGTSTDLKHEQEIVSTYEQRFQQAAGSRAPEIGTKPQSVADAYSTDYMADYGRSTSYAKQQDGEGKTLAADFTPAAEGTQTTADRKPDQAAPTAGSPATPQV